jgi:beta-galactosidase
VAEDSVKTAGAPARLVLLADRPNIASDGADLAFITVRVEDKNGTLCPDAANEVKFSVSGPGQIAAVDNGDSATFEPFQADHRSAFHGVALVIVRPAKGAAGTIAVQATSDGIAPATLTIRSGASAAPSSAPE